jgi:protein TonB
LVRAVCVCLSLLAHLAPAAALFALPKASAPVLMEFHLVAMPGTPDAPLFGEGIKKGVPDGEIGADPPPASSTKKTPPPPSEPAPVEPVVEKRPDPPPPSKPAPEKPVVKKRPVPPSPAPRVAERPAPVPPKPTVPERVAANVHAESEQDVGTSGEHAAGQGSSGTSTAHGSGAAQPRGLPTGSGSGRFGLSAGGDGGTYTFGAAGAPTFLRRVVPKYPRRSVVGREEGVVMLLLSLDEHGTLLDVFVEQSAGSRLDEAAVRAARASTYKPAVVDGKARACRARLPIRFRLQK